MDLMDPMDFMDRMVTGRGVPAHFAGFQSLWTATPGLSTRS